MLNNLDKVADILPHLPAAGGGGGGAAIGAAVGGGTDGSILFVGAGGVLAQDNAGLFYDDADNQLVLGAGLVGKPSLIFGDDTTGMYRPAVDNIGWSVSGIAAMRLGGVGPDSDQIWAMGRCLIDSRLTDEVCISHRDQQTSGTQGIRIGAAGYTTINAATGQNVGFSINNSTRWQVTATGPLQPATDNVYDLGATALRVRRSYLSEYMELSEMTAPAVAPANKVRLFSQDNGSGKTQLMAIFPTGFAIQIAIEA